MSFPTQRVNAVQVKADSAQFDGVLGSDDANLQVALQTLDEHHPGGSVREVLGANRTYYVRTDGNDSNTGLANTAAGAFLTIQRAVDVISGLDISGYVCTIQVADGTYTGAVTLKNVVGFAALGNLIIQGNSGTPANVYVNPTSANGFAKNGAGSVWTIKDMKIACTTAGNAIDATNGGYITFSNIDFGTMGTFGVHISAATNGTIVAAGNYTVSGNARVHISSDTGGFVLTAFRTITFSNNPVFTYFAVFAMTGLIQAYSMTFTNGATVTAQKFLGYLNGACQTNSTVNYFPGGTAGTTATGAQYA